MSHKKLKISSKPQKEVLPVILQEKSSKLVISYEYLDLNSKKYTYNAIGDNRTRIDYHNDYYSKIKEYSECDNFRKRINSDRRFRSLNHIHPIDWNDDSIRECKFNCLNDALMEQIKGECWQLGINRHTFRMHGFFIENVFYVVWIDPNHELYHSK